AAEFALGAHLAGYTGHLRGERTQLLAHGVDRVLEFQDLAAHVHGDLLGQVAVGYRCRYFGDVANLVGEVARHEVHVVGQVFPRAGHPAYIGLAAELTLRTYLTGHPRHFRGERTQLIDHGVDRVLEFQNLAAHVHGDLLGQIAVRYRRRHRGDVADLARQVTGHEVHVVGQVFPHAGHTFHFSLAAELTLGAHLTGLHGDLPIERAQLIDHGVDRVLEFQDLAAHVHGDLLGQVAVGDRCRYFGDVANLVGEVGG